MPYSKEDLDHYATELQLVFAREWFMVAEEGDKAVGMAITIPDVNQVLKRDEGDGCCRSAGGTSCDGAGTSIAAASASWA